MFYNTYREERSITPESVPFSYEISSSAFGVDLLYLQSHQGDEPHRQYSLLPRELSVGQVFLFLFCGEGMTVGHGLWFVLPVCRGKGLTFQCQSFSCGFAVCSGQFLAGISWAVRGAIVSEGCLVGDYSLLFCA